MPAAPVVACLSPAAAAVFLLVVFGAGLLLFLGGGLLVLLVFQVPQMARHRYVELVDSASELWRIVRPLPTADGPYRARAHVVERIAPARALKRAALFAIFSGDVALTFAPLACTVMLEGPIRAVGAVGAFAGALLLSGSGERLLLEPDRAFRHALVTGGAVSVAAVAFGALFVSGAAHGELTASRLGAGALSLLSASLAYCFFAAAREVSGLSLRRGETPFLFSTDANRRKLILGVLGLLFGVFGLVLAARLGR